MCLKNTPVNILDTLFAVLVVDTDGRKGDGGLKQFDACVLPVFFQRLWLFCSLLFISQSKEYPRNVPENPTRKYVEKEVCKQAIMGERKREESDWYVLSKVSAVTPSSRSQSTNWNGQHGNWSADELCLYVLRCYIYMIKQPSDSECVTSSEFRVYIC